MDLMIHGFGQAFQFNILILIILGVLAGIMIGSLPGLTATMGVALFLPISLGMDAVGGIVLLIAVYFGSIYGGSIAAILLNTPGTPASAATALDGYPMTQAGYAGKALAIAAIASGAGGLISTLMLTLISPQLSTVALNFSAPESFALALFGLSIISSISGKSVLKGLTVGVFGLIIATVGMDPMTSYPRFTFDQPTLLSGISFIPVMIGLFAVAEALYQIEKHLKVQERTKNVVANYLLPKFRELKVIWISVIRSSFIGTFIGSVPGAGADIAAFVSYNEAKRFSKKEEKDSFGKGNPKGIASAEAANNGVTGGAMVPLLTLGIPGDAVAAVLLGALMIHGMNPGPMLFVENAEMVYTLFAGMFLAAILVVIFGLLGVRLFTKVLLVPKRVLLPTIIVLSIVGAYAISNNYFDVYVMLVFGIIGYFMKKYGFPASPLVLALILGPMAESEMRRSLVMSEGSYAIFMTRPIAATLIVLAVLSMIAPIVFRYLKHRKESKAADS
ncbi:C4-dicarboxylate ABC transporter permease [Alteribacter lacisalsi]|uniref:C4-dicarboxylate ABC transporter permease n=1 Tax=Alteribacter lacisalsi TaxID=2045244 RepID=A0A2W0H5L4_9BACI|nr:tripartite tricarboxylate transporter permease [Alteribacter lacisalsi]PYZ95916.1 C4-dicarboxylate ABC transporter permease [Alteribacter lacisalsi]